MERVKNLSYLNKSQILKYNRCRTNKVAQHLAVLHHHWHVIGS